MENQQRELMHLIKFKRKNSNKYPRKLYPEKEEQRQMSQIKPRHNFKKNKKLLMTSKGKSDFDIPVMTN